MTNAEIIELLAEMVAEEMRQEPIAQYEFEGLLYYYLCFDLMIRRNSTPTPIELGNPQLGGNQLAQTYAASLPADDFVNDPCYPAEFRNAAGAAIVADWSSGPSLRGL